MNKVFKVIFNQSLGIFLAVSELAKGRAKSKSSFSQKTKSKVFTFHFSALAIAIAASISPLAEADLYELSTTNFDMEGNTQFYEKNTTFYDYRADKLLGHSNLVIKTVFEGAEYSPHEWQLGINYWWKKVHGDRQEYYPFYTKYKRSDDVFLRSMAPNSTLRESKQWFNYVAEHKGLLGDNLTLHNQPTLGHIALDVPEEPAFTYEIIPNIQERQFKEQKIELKLNEPEIKELVPQHVTVSPQKPITPNLERVTFKPVIPEKVIVNTPNIPKTQAPKPIVFLAYPDCNASLCPHAPITTSGSNSYVFHGWTGGNGDSGDINPENTPYFLYGTWRNFPHRGSMSSLVFKMVFTENIPTYSFGEDSKPKNLSNTIQVDSFNLPEKPKDPSEEANFKDNYFYNQGYAQTETDFEGKNKQQRWREDLNLTDILKQNGASEEFYNKILNRNRQYFLIGGSRALEADDNNYIHWFADHSLKLAGPLVIGIAKQDTSNNHGIINNGDINDVDENTLDKIKNMPTDDGKDYLTLVGPRKPQYLSDKNVCSDTSATDCIDEYTTFKIQKSADGYVGRKVGMMALEEDNEYAQGYVKNNGNIDLRGPSSIGMYVYIPKNRSVGDNNDRLVFENKENANISISGENSYGMKWSAQSSSRLNSAQNNSFLNAGNIILRKNPGTKDDGVTPGEDKADSSVGMGLLVDPTLYSKHTSLKKNIAKNTGKILIKDNLNNATGQFIDIASNMSNEGIIRIEGIPEDENSINVAQYAKQENLEKTAALNGVELASKRGGAPNFYYFGQASQTEIKNTKDAKIELTTKNAIGQIADGVENNLISASEASKAEDQKQRVEVQALASNTGFILFGTADKNSTKLIGQLAKNGAKISNEGSIKTIENATTIHSFGMIVNGLKDDKAQTVKAASGELAGEISLKGDHNIGVFNNGEFTSKVKANGTKSIITLDGDENTLIFNSNKVADKDLSSDLNAGQFTASNTTFTLANTSKSDNLSENGKGFILQGGNGSIDSSQFDIKVVGKSSVGFSNDGGILNITNSENSINVKDGVGINNLGTTSIEGNLEGKALTVNAYGDNALAIYNSGTNNKLTITEATINLNTIGDNNHSGVAVFNDNGSTLFLGDKADTNCLNDSQNCKVQFNIGKKGLFLYNIPSDKTNFGKLVLNNTSRVNLKNGATGFYISGANIDPNGYVTFVSDNALVDESLTNQDAKLVINIEKGSTIAVLDKPQGSALKLSNVSTDNTTGKDNKLIKHLNKFFVGEGTTSDYKEYKVYRGKFKVDKDVNLDNDGTTSEPKDSIYKTEFLASSITIEDGHTVIGRKKGLVAFYQGNYDEGTEKGKVVDIELTNNGRIILSGDSIENANTTTALAGDFITITNNGQIDVTGKNNIAIFAANGSQATNTGTINIGGKNTVAIYGKNKIATSDIGDNTIHLTNTGSIQTAADGESNLIGMYADNDTAFNATSKVENKGIIDLANSENSVNIFVKNSEFKQDANAKLIVGKQGIGINAITSKIQDESTVTLAGEGATLYQLSDELKVDSTLSATVTVNGNKASIINLHNIQLDTLPDNSLTVSGEGEDFVYLNMANNSKIGNYNVARNFNQKGATFANVQDSNLTVNKALTLTGNDSHAIRVTALNQDSRVVVNDAIKMGKHALGASLQSQNNHQASLTMNGAVTIGDNGTGIYVEGNNTILNLTNKAKFTLGSDANAVYVVRDTDNGTALNIAKGVEVNSNGENVKGIIVKNKVGTPWSWVNNANIQLTGLASVGIAAEGANQALTNNANIVVGNSNEYGRSIGIYMDKDQDSNTLINNGNITVGKLGIGLYGYGITHNINKKLDIGESGIGIYSEGKDVAVEGNMILAKGSANNQTTAIYKSGDGKVTLAASAHLDLGEQSTAVFIKAGSSADVESNIASNTLKEGSMYVYNSGIGHVISHTNLKGNGNNQYAYYLTNGLLENNGNIDLSSSHIATGIFAKGNGKAINNSAIKVGTSNSEKQYFSIGMAAKGAGASITNKGTIEVKNKGGIAMYAIDGGRATNEGQITLDAEKAIGIYLGKNAVGENKKGAKITITANGDGAKAIFMGEGSIFKNYGTVEVKADATGIYDIRDCKQDGECLASSLEQGNIMTSNGGDSYHNVMEGCLTEKMTGKNGDKEGLKMDFSHDPSSISIDGVKLNSELVKMTYSNSHNDSQGITFTGGLEEQFSLPEIHNMFKRKSSQSSISTIGMYVDSSGIDYTHPIIGMNNLGNIRETDLYIGTEASRYTNSRVIVLKEDIMKPYLQTMKDAINIEKWNLYSSSLLWFVGPYAQGMDLSSVVLAKMPFTATVVNRDVNEYNFLDGLEQRYAMNDIYSREKSVFNKLNSIGKNEPILYYQAINEMIGNQYATNTRRQIETKSLYDLEFDSLLHWDTSSEQTTRVKVFGEKAEYNSDKMGLISHDRNSKGLYVLHSDAPLNTVINQGVFAGLSKEDIEFQDLGESKEKALTAQLGYYRLNHNTFKKNADFLFKLGIQGARRKMERKFWVVDDTFEANSRYWDLGLFLDSQLSKEYALDRQWTVEPKVGLDLAYRYTSKINEKDGQIRLNVKSHNSYTVKPKLGATIKHIKQFDKGRFISQLDVNAWKDFGVHFEKDVKAKVNYTDAGYYNLTKDKRKFNVDAMLKFTLEKPNYGIGIRAGYNFTLQQSQYGLEFKVKF